MFSRSTNVIHLTPRMLDRTMPYGAFALAPRMEIGILGPGRLGRSLSVLLGRLGVAVDLRGRGQGIPDGSVVLLTVPEGQIEAAARSVPTGRTVLHCSGSMEIDVLRPHRPAGSFHPLMSFPGPEIALPDLTGVPAALAGDPEALAVGRQLAALLGMTPVEVPGDRRLYHAAAVMAGNFATILLAEASLVMAAAGVDPVDAPRLLAPLALRSISNAVDGPARALTGPIARGEAQVLQGHLDALREAGLERLFGLTHAFHESGQRLVDNRGQAAQAEAGEPEQG
jgi:predicted short-subunit dehydrogenase-like oxidoreductase (DUF2520 family)